MPDVICDLTFKEVSPPPATTIPTHRAQGCEATSVQRCEGMKPHTLMPWKSLNSVDHARCCHLWFDLQRGVHTTCKNNTHPRAWGHLHPCALVPWKSIVLIMPDLVICDLTFKEVSQPPATTIPIPRACGQFKLVFCSPPPISAKSSSKFGYEMKCLRCPHHLQVQSPPHPAFTERQKAFVGPHHRPKILQKPSEPPIITKNDN